MESGCFIASSFRDRAVTVGDAMEFLCWRGEATWWGDISWRRKTIWAGRGEVARVL
jgi:hypothetical protein